MPHICVISGSPKGEFSITYHTVLWIQKHFGSTCTFETFHIGKRPPLNLEAMEEGIRRSDIVLFCYPVYTFMVPWQLHRTIELLKQGDSLHGKFYAQVSTSKHFYDTTAHAFIRENCADMDMHDLGSLSADMDDLTTERGRSEALAFWNLVLWRHSRTIGQAEPQTGHIGDGKIAIIASVEEGDSELAAMIERFRESAPLPTELHNINEYPFKGGCISCFNCASDGTCIYKDGFDTFLRNQIQTADSIVYAFRIKDHSMGSQMKLYDDRQFCNGHRTVTMGMPVGYIVAGDLSRERNLDLIMRARADVGGNFLCGIACDGNGIDELSATLRYALQNRLRQPQTFLGIGGMKIFRDLIYIMQGLMRADYRFFKEHGQFDFPQKQRGTIWKIKLVGLLFNSPKLKAKAGPRINEGMIAPYKKAIEQEK